VARLPRHSRTGELPVAGALLAHGWESPALVAITLVLVGLGLITVYSASAVMALNDGLADYYYVVRQASGAAVGFVLLGLMATLDYRHLRLFAWPVLLCVMVTLLIMVLPGTHALAPVTNGARRWLYLGPIALQPSEFAKLALIIWTAALAVKKQDKLASLFRGLAPFLLIWGLVGGLVFIQPSMSAAGLIVLLAALVAFAGGARIGHFILLGAVGLPLAWSQIQNVGYRASRIASFLDPNYDPAGASYQINQALIAVGSGGVWGRGLGHGLQKYGFVPEPHNDFLLAMIGEEWGFLGMSLVIVLFGLFTLIGFRIARDAEDLFGFLLAIGITSMIAIHALMHILINLAWFPTTGVTLPLMSYGRSSLLVCLAGVGILMSIARRRGASV
jgi:cell division protein FtsW